MSEEQYQATHHNDAILSLFFFTSNATHTKKDKYPHWTERNWISIQQMTHKKFKRKMSFHLEKLLCNVLFPCARYTILPLPLPLIYICCSMKIHLTFSFFRSFSVLFISIWIVVDHSKWRFYQTQFITLRIYVHCTAMISVCMHTGKKGKQMK